MDAELHTLLLKKAVALLARRAYSRGELRIKLAEVAGAPQVEAALDRLAELDLLNDADYAYNFALCRMRQKGWGPAKVRDGLLRRRVAAPTVERALERARNELGGPRAVAEYLQKRYGQRGLPTDRKGMRKLESHLRGRGFDEDEILGTLKRMIPGFDTGE